ADAQVLFDGELREDLAPLRDIADPYARPLARVRSRELAIAEDDAAGAHRDEAHDRAEERRLSDTISPHHDGARTLRRDQGCPPERVAAAVVLVNVAGFEHVTLPGRPRPREDRSA